MQKMTFIDLCAGIGGFSLGLEWAGMTCKAQVEIDEFCTEILKKHWPHVPKFGDIHHATASDLPAVDLIAGGYPCQPFSLTGNRKGKEDDRHIWPEIFRIVKQKKPTWCLFENVVGHLTLGIDQVLFDLESEGYEVQSLVLPACAVNAPHRRDRLWIIAHSDSKYRRSSAEKICSKQQGRASKPKRNLVRQTNRATTTIKPYPACKNFGGRESVWESEPDVGRVAHGVPQRVDRVRALGNAVVPQLVCEIGLAIKQAHFGF